MHIGFFSSHLGTQGGPVIVDKRVLEAISGIDHRNTYTVYGVTRQSTEDLQLAGSNGNINIKTIKPSGRWPVIAFGLTLELMRHPVDLLHATIVPPPVVPCKFVLTITCWSQFAQPKFYPALKRWRMQYLLRKGIRNATAVFCYTEFLKGKLVGEFDIDPERIFITQPGLGDEVKPVEDKDYLSSFLKNMGINAPYILFIGAMTKRKNVEGLVKAYYILKSESRIEHKLVLLGERIFLSDSIYETIEQLNLTDDVILIDRRPHHELPLFYSGADVFVFPTFSEGFGLPPLEAMACGTPVVASNVTSVPEVVGDAAVMIDPYRPEDIARGILKCLTDDKLRADLNQRGIERAREFTWTKTAQQTIDAYEKVHQSGW
jgi:glycosyltransferase involved in cell wall biosynthesis